MRHDRKEKSSDRIFNFGAGPAVLPEPVLEARRDLLALPEWVVDPRDQPPLEDFRGDLEGSIADIGRLAAIQPTTVLFVGGARRCSSPCVPMKPPPGRRFRRLRRDRLLVEKAVKGEEGGGVLDRRDDRGGSFARIPTSRRSPRPGAAYLHFTTTTRSTEPSGRPTGRRRGAAVADACQTSSAARSTSASTPSSTRARRRTSGAAASRRDPPRRPFVQSSKTLPTMLDYNTHA